MWKSKLWRIQFTGIEKTLNIFCQLIGVDEDWEGVKSGLNALEAFVVVGEGGCQSQVGEQLHSLLLGDVVRLQQVLHDVRRTLAEFVNLKTQVLK